MRVQVILPVLDEAVALPHVLAGLPPDLDTIVVDNGSTDATAEVAAPLLGLGMRDRRFGWPLEMVLRAATAGWRVQEVPVPYAPRVGRSKVTGPVRSTAHAVHDMATVRR